MRRRPRPTRGLSRQGKKMCYLFEIIHVPCSKFTIFIPTTAQQKKFNIFMNIWYSSYMSAYIGHLRGGG
jgi:hypothetical protein